MAHQAQTISDGMIIKILVFIAIVAMPGIAHAAEWECWLPGADQKVILTQQGEPEKAESGEVKGTVTGPYGRMHDAKVSIDGFDRRWDYVDRGGEYSVVMQPSGLVGFYDFTGLKEGDLRESSYDLYCEKGMTEEERRRVEEEERRRVEEEERRRSEQEIKARKFAEENPPSLNTLRDAYIFAIQQKIERNWLKPAGSGNMPVCEVLVLQGPGGIILDVSFGACDDSSLSYRASIENAVYRAEPLPSPGDPELFERELNFFFNSSE